MKFFPILCLLGLTITTGFAQDDTITLPDANAPGGWLNNGLNGWVLTPIPSKANHKLVAHGLLSSNPVIAETSTPEIQALARGLENDPLRIFDYVHDHIRHSLYFGSVKGAQLTLSEQSGNDFDQCALLVSLLREAGYSPGYGFGLVQMPFNSANHVDLQHWLGLNVTNTDWSTQFNYISALLGNAGFTTNDIFDMGDNNTIAFHRLWVVVTIGGTTYNLDPAFKISTAITGINLPAAMSFNTNDLITAAAGSSTADYATNLNEGNLRNKLRDYTTNLLYTLKNNYPNYSVDQILGGQQIVPWTNTLPQSLLFSTYTDGGVIPTQSWDNIADPYLATLSLNFAGTGYWWYTAALQGQRLSLTFDASGNATLWQDDTSLVTASPGVTTLSVSDQFIFPAASWDTTANSINANFTISHSGNYYTGSSTYAIVYGFDISSKFLHQRQDVLNTYIQEGYTNGSRQVLSETLNVMGLNWMLQTELVDRMLAHQGGLIQRNYDRIGAMGQVSGQGFYIDVYGNDPADFPNDGIGASQMARSFQNTDVLVYFASAMEHGVIEQSQSNSLAAASTVKMLEVGNAKHLATYLATSNNWNSIKGKLTNWDTNGLVSYINSGYSLLLTKDGKQYVSGSSGWQGYGFQARNATYSTNGFVNSLGIFMKIKGNYNGGFAGFPNTPIDTPYIWSGISANPITFNPVSTFVPSSVAGDPVNMPDASFHVNTTDLSLGQPEPLGLSLNRSYTATRRHHNLANVGNGWVHNYYFNLSEMSDPETSLGTTTPAQAVPMLVATCAALNFYKPQPDPKNWMVTALIAKWAIDQITTNAVSISLGSDGLEFMHLPDGSYAPPGNCTYTLTKNSTYTLKERHGNTFNFNSSKQLTTITNQSGDPLTFTYSSGKLTKATDWQGRTLTFTNSGTPSRLTGVGDSSGRSVLFGYTTNTDGNLDLVSVTDPEGKTSTFNYDTNHQITATKDALARLVITNQYDGFGHVTTQYTQGDTNKSWQIYWSGWETVAQDPAGSKHRYFYDDQLREIGEQDELGNTSQTFYDGQDHVIETISPLNETNLSIYDGKNNLIATVDPLNFTNQLVYDSQNNLIRTIDPLGHTNSFGYNAQFLLTGQTNGAGDYVTFTYNSDGTLHTRTDAGGTTTNGYDTFGQLSSIAYPNGLGSESYANNALGDVTNYVDARGFATRFQYNNRRQLTNSVAPTNVVTKIAFDAIGNSASTTDARGNITSNTWSVTRHLLTTTLPPTTQGTPVITNAYDNRDWLARTVDPLQNMVNYTNDAAQRLISQTDPLLRTTKFIYDADGHTLASINAANETNNQTWDARGSLIKLTDGAGHFSTRAYDGAGNQIILTNRNGKKWQFQFDAANRLTNTISPLNHSTSVTFNRQGLVATTKDPANQTNALYYDAKGRLTNRTDNVAITIYRYDANDSMTNVVEAGHTNGWAYDAYNRIQSYKDVYGNLIQYRYDNAGNLTNLIYPGNRNVYYAFDNLNRMTNVTDWANRKTGFTYDLAGQIKNITRPNGTQRIVGYDAAGQVTNILEKTAIGFPIALFRHNWNLSATMQWEFAAPLPHTNTPPTRIMTYDDDNQLSKVDWVYVTNDLDGNLTSGPLTNDTFTTYNYDARNRLLNAGGVTNVYDAANNRIGQTYGANTAIFVVNPVSKLPQVLMRIKNGGTNYYIYGAGLLYQITETATATNTLTYHYDYRGSTVALTDNNGNVTDRMEYSLYATMTYRSGSTDTPFLFNGRYGIQTDQNGLLYMRARYYNPFLCRFINPDPSGFVGGLNFFAYANGNPVSLLDPFGLNAAATGDSSFNWGTRAWGALETLGGGLTTAAGYTFGTVTAPTVAGGVAGAVVGTYGVDMLQAGIRQMWTGQNTPTMVQSSLQSAGMSPTGAAWTSAGIGLVLTGGTSIYSLSSTVNSVPTISSSVYSQPVLAAITPEGRLFTNPNLLLSHQVFARQVLGVTGTELPSGAWVGTVGTINGQTVGLNSFTFFGNQAPANQAVQTILRTTAQ